MTDTPKIPTAIDHELVASLHRRQHYLDVLNALQAAHSSISQPSRLWKWHKIIFQIATTPTGKCVITLRRMKNGVCVDQVGVMDHLR